MEINTIDFLRGSFSSVFFIAVFFFSSIRFLRFSLLLLCSKSSGFSFNSKELFLRYGSLFFFFANPLIQYCRSLVSNLYLCWSRFVTARSVLFHRRSKGKSVFLQLAHLVFIIDVTLLIYRSSFEKKNLLIGDTGLAIVGYSVLSVCIGPRYAQHKCYRFFLLFYGWVHVLWLSAMIKIDSYIVFFFLF